MSSWGTPPTWAAVAIIGVIALTVAQVCTLRHIGALRALRVGEVEQARRSLSDMDSVPRLLILHKHADHQT